MQSGRKAIGTLDGRRRRALRGIPRVALVGFALALAGVGLEVRAEEPEPSVGLDQLLRLPPPRPSSAGDPTDRPGGATAPEWRARFAAARAEIARAEEALDEAQAKLARISTSSGQWQMSAPGLGGKTNSDPTNSPVSYELHQEVRRQREEIERGERRLQELKVEASLAGVPEAWTRPPGDPAADPSRGSAQP